VGIAMETQKNQLYLENLGLDPLPTFHYGTDYTELEVLVKKYKYLGLGGLTPIFKDKKKLINHFSKCFNILNKNKTKAHGWGTTAYDILIKFPFYSVDSTSWLSGGKFGNIVEFKNNKLKSGNWNGNTKKLNYKTINKFNIENYIKMSRQVSLLWKERGISWD